MSSASGGVFLTYKAPVPGDGAGAQVQRVMAIYGVAKNLGLSYLHSPIMHFGPNPGDSFSTPADRDNFLVELNDFLTLPSSPVSRLRLFFSIGRPPRYIYRSLPRFHRLLKLLKISLILRLENPYGYVDRYPDAYGHASALLHPRLPETRIPREHFVVDVHIRRTLNPPLDIYGRPYERHLETEWYLFVLEQVKATVSWSNKPLLIRVHTDRDPSSGTWNLPEDTPQGSIELWNSVGALQADNSIRYDAEDFQTTFEGIGKVEVLTNIDPIEAWATMASADLLVTGPSSFSFVGGLVRFKRPTISPVFWHSSPKHWLVLPKNFHELKRDREKYRQMIAILLYGFAGRR